MAEDYNKLLKEMLDLAEVPLTEQDEEAKAEETPAEEEPAEGDEGKAADEGELSDEWEIKIANFTLKMKWLNNYRRLGIKFRGPTKYMNVPKKLVVQEGYREPFLRFLRQVLDFMSTGNTN
jgi:hypothetical protein